MFQVTAKDRFPGSCGSEKLGSLWPAVGVSEDKHWVQVQSPGLSDLGLPTGKGWVLACHLSETVPCIPFLCPLCCWVSGPLVPTLDRWGGRSPLARPSAGSQKRWQHLRVEVAVRQTWKAAP